MVRLRLRRVGRKKQPSYRIVAADKESPRDGRFLEVVGFYNPRTQPETIQIKEDRVYHWMSNGAQPSDSVARIFKTVGADERFARFKAGEDVEKLLEESVAALEKFASDGKTRHDAPKQSKKKAEEAAAPAAEVVEEAAEEVEAPVEEAAPVAEVEAPVEEEAPAEEAEAPAKEEAPAEEAEATTEEEAPAEEAEAKEEEAAE